jgi:hypothetical protein
MIGEAIAPDVARQLRDLMLQIAARSGDPDPTSMAAVTARRPDALRAVGGGVVPSRQDETTYLVRVEGSFTLGRRNPVAHRLVTGRYLTVLVNPSTLRHTDLGVGNRPLDVPMEDFGPVSDLMQLG